VGKAGTPILEAAAVLATAATHLGALFALARLRGVPGLWKPDPVAQRLDVFAASSFVWALAGALS